MSATTLMLIEQISQVSEKIKTAQMRGEDTRLLEEHKDDLQRKLSLANDALGARTVLKG